MRRIILQTVKPFIKEFLTLIAILAIVIPGLFITGLVHMEIRFTPITVSAMAVFGFECARGVSRVVSYGTLAALDLLQQRVDRGTYLIKGICPYRLSAMTQSRGSGGAEVIYTVAAKNKKEIISLLSAQYPELEIGKRYVIDTTRHTKMIISAKEWRP